MRNPKDFIFLLRDFVLFVMGKDYLRQPQPLGLHFTNPSCYYNDVRGKATWTGSYVNGVPALKLASDGKSVVLPVMVFFFGLGSLDCYFTTGDKVFIDQVRHVAAWAVASILEEGYFDNQCIERDPGFQYFSNNSGMTQGLAISFMARVIRYNLVERNLSRKLGDLIKVILCNMLQANDRGGTSLRKGDDLFFQEFCRKDGNVVLNGWIYAVFGLIDYLKFIDAGFVRSALIETISTMERVLPSYHLSSGWSLYDNMGRVCSPFYHDLHIALMDAIGRLTGREVFRKYSTIAARANTRLNRALFTLNKIKEKLLIDKEHYICA